MGATGGPFAWQPHLFSWAILASVTCLVIAGHLRLSRSGDRPIPWTRRQIAAFVGALVASVVALTWPLADLAAHWSLAALVTQRLILLLAVAPLLLLGVPYDVLRRITRPPVIDGLLTRLQQPVAAIAMVSVLVVGSMVPSLVRAQSGSLVARGVISLVIVLAGVVLWLPVLGRVPGIPKLRPVVRFGYLVAQAVIPGFLSIIYIFSNHALYPEFARSRAAIGLRPLTDQQMAGFISKVTLLLVLLSVGAVVLARAPVSEEELGENEPLVWADVEREFERADRRHPDGAPAEPLSPAGRRRAGPGGGPGGSSPPSPPGSGHGLSGHPTTNREPPDG
ncbi:MAG: cytochrome c oxidase assembly protein, partial [Acidimicrobiales bacterium]